MSKTIYMVIGGFFPKAIESGLFKVIPYQRLYAVIVEGISMKNILLNNGLRTNTYVIPNFKKYNFHSEKRIKIDNNCIQFVFVSRIHPDKGVFIIAEACDHLNSIGIDNYSVSFYGIIDKAFKQKFDDLLNERLLYKGVLDFQSNESFSYSKLSEFDVMLFPTFWIGEGFPGVLIDAFIAGIPVIASDWNMNNEVISDGVNGFLIPPRNSLELANAMKKMILDKALRTSMRSQSQIMATQFHVDNILPQLFTPIITNNRVFENV